MACKGSNGRPIKAYPLKGDAEDAAKATSEMAGKAFVAYKHEECGTWHISPEDRVTPSEPCKECGKQLYDSQESAEKRAKVTRDQSDQKLNVYQCPHSDGWHLTKQ